MPRRSTAVRAVPRPRTTTTPTETGLTKNQIISVLSRSSHGDLQGYVSVGQAAARQEPEFLAHLIAWNQLKGQVRDSKVALPVAALSVADVHPEFAENAFAHLVRLGPRELEKAYRFALTVKLPGRMRQLRRLVSSYLTDLESNWAKFERTAILHKHTLANLYALTHTARKELTGEILFKGARPEGSLFEAVHQLKTMTATEAAGTILERRIPFLVAQGALGAKSKDADLVLALIKRMSPTELVTNTKWLESAGMKTNAALRGAYEEALEKASKSKKNVLKTTRAAEAISDEGLKSKLGALQEKQLENLSVEGDWLVLADKSGSMTAAIETAGHVAGLLAKMAKGRVTLVFFDSVAARVFECAGKTYEEIKSDTTHVSANGGTCIGAGVQRAIDRSDVYDGIAIVSDGGETTAPYFADAYARYSEMIGKEVPVYLYHCGTKDETLTRSMAQAQKDMQIFDLTHGKIDFYSLPNLVGTMRTQRYGLVEEIMATPLLKLKEGIKYEREEEPVYAAGV